jgi:hypothetical protein
MEASKAALSCRTSDCAQRFLWQQSVCPAARWRGMTYLRGRVMASHSRREGAAASRSDTAAKPGPRCSTQALLWGPSPRRVPFPRSKLPNAMEPASHRRPLVVVRAETGTLAPAGTSSAPGLLPAGRSAKQGRRLAPSGQQALTRCPQDVGPGQNPVVGLAAKLAPGWRRHRGKVGVEERGGVDGDRGAGPLQLDVPPNALQAQVDCRGSRRRGKITGATAGNQPEPLLMSGGARLGSW